MIPFTLAAVFYDFAGGKIPNRLILAGIGCAVCYGLYFAGFRQLPQMLAGMAIPIVFLFVLFRIGAMGGGDLKLLSFLGALFGFHILEVILYAFIFGAGQSLIQLLLNHPFFQRFHMKKAHTIHFSLSIFVAAFYVAFFLHP